MIPSHLNNCPICKVAMQIVVNPNKIIKDPSEFVWTEDLIYKCYFCDHMQDFEGNMIHALINVKKCPVCNTNMRLVEYPKSAKSVWAGQNVYLCFRCAYSEDKRGNEIPKWHPPRWQR